MRSLNLHPDLRPTSQPADYAKHFETARCAIGAAFPALDVHGNPGPPMGFFATRNRKGDVLAYVHEMSGERIQYPRTGAFEVYTSSGTVLFSKLMTQRWPRISAEGVHEIVGRIQRWMHWRGEAPPPTIAALASPPRPRISRSPNTDAAAGHRALETSKSATELSRVQVVQPASASRDAGKVRYAVLCAALHTRRRIANHRHNARRSRCPILPPHSLHRRLHPSCQHLPSWPPLFSTPKSETRGSSSTGLRRTVASTG